MADFDSRGDNGRVSGYQAGYIDVHCHQPCRRGAIEIVSIDLARESVPVDGFFSLGIHPWFMADQDCDASFIRLEAACADPRLLAVGECGLDRSIAVPLARQIACFERQLAVAEACRKPVVIHCVRAYEELLRIRKRHGCRLPWVVHGFNRNAAIAEQLLKHGCYLSLGAALLDSRQAVATLLPALPVDRLFLETDAGEATIETLYRIAADRIGLTRDALQRQLTINFNRVFRHD